MKNVPSSFRPEVVHALTRSSLFRKEERNRRSIIANRLLLPVEKGMFLFVTHKHIEDLAVVQRHEATGEEIQKAFEALARRAKRNPSPRGTTW